jgi:hypothetical protein
MTLEGDGGSLPLSSRAVLLLPVLNVSILCYVSFGKGNTN